MRTPRCWKQSGQFSKSRSLSSTSFAPLSLPPLPYFALTPLFVDFYYFGQKHHGNACCASKGTTKWVYWSCNARKIHFNSWIYLFFKWSRVSDHQRQWLTKIINTERLIVSWLNAYAVLSVKCHARSTKSLKSFDLSLSK
mgnify:CR=1 FL=1